jgi:MtN3 and saliva related transmembrane protein
MEYEIIGYIGAGLISVNLIPQVYHIYRLKNADSISTVTIGLNVLSAAVMLTYGVCINQYPVIISNGMIIVFYSVIGYFKYEFLPL